MRCIFYVYQEYTYRDKVLTRNYPLYDLYEFLSDKQSRWIHLEDDDRDPRKVIIWSEDYLKPSPVSFAFKSLEDEIAEAELYSKYAMKRFYEMPAIRIFRDNYEFLELQMKEIHARKPLYLIFREHDNGYVDILEKDELSPEDLTIMKREAAIYQNYLKRWQEYVKNHPEKQSPIWQSPDDSEFESDFALYDPADLEGVD